MADPWPSGKPLQVLRLGKVCQKLLDRDWPTDVGMPMRGHCWHCAEFMPWQALQALCSKVRDASTSAV